MTHLLNRTVHLALGVGLAASLLMSGCVAPRKLTTKAAKFPLMYEEKPAAILVLPPINRTTAADAKDYYATTIAAPLAFSGFYVLPIEVTSDLLKSQGIYDTETILNHPISKFKQYFGADAVLYTEITKWSTAYAVIAANLTVGFTASLKSTHTERPLWEYSGTIVVDLTGRSNSGNILADLVVGAIATSIAAAAADYVPYATLVNSQILQTIPVGKYREEHLKDQMFPFLDLTPEQGPLQSETIAVNDHANRFNVLQANSDGGAISEKSKVALVEPEGRAIRSLESAIPAPLTSEASQTAAVVPIYPKIAPEPLSTSVQTEMPVLISMGQIPTESPTGNHKSSAKTSVLTPEIKETDSIKAIIPPRFLGLQVYALNNEILVRSITLKSAAAEAGIRVGDKIVSFGKDMEHGNTFSTLQKIHALNSTRQGSTDFVWQSAKGSKQQTSTLTWSDGAITEVR